MILKVDNVIQNPDGTATVNFEIDDEMEMYIAKSFGVDVQDLKEEQVQEFVHKAITKMVEKKNEELQNPAE